MSATNKGIPARLWTCAFNIGLSSFLFGYCLSSLNTVFSVSIIAFCIPCSCDCLLFYFNLYPVPTERTFFYAQTGSQTDPIACYEQPGLCPKGSMLNDLRLGEGTCEIQCFGAFLFACHTSLRKWKTSNSLPFSPLLFACHLMSRSPATGYRDDYLRRHDRWPLRFVPV